jgi:RNA polymerase sigma-70 factor (ECF subfamily)
VLHERISKLAYVDRAIVMLWLEGMSYDEIGAVVGITAQNVATKLFRIKEQLKKM